MSDGTVRPFLMFEGRAEEAMNFYVSVIPRSEVLEIVRFGPGEAGREGSVMRATFSIGGQSIMCTDSVVAHDFTFTPSISFFVDCASGDEVDRLANALARDGAVLMPPDSYGFSRRFAWVTDRYGVSWQMNLG